MNDQTPVSPELTKVFADESSYPYLAMIRAFADLHHAVVEQVTLGQSLLPSQAMMLWYMHAFLQNNAVMYAGDIIRHNMYDGQNVSYNLKKLKNGHYIMMSPDPLDARRVSVRLADKGVYVVRAIDAGMEKMEAKLTAELKSVPKDLINDIRHAAIAVRLKL